MGFKRLEGILELITDKGGVADIGTDHGYLPIMLVKRDRMSGLKRCIIASDVSDGPLEAIMRNLAREGLSDSISVRRGHGFSTIVKGEVSTFVIAGMGGQTVIDIIATSLTTVSTPITYGCQMVLQTNNRGSELRKWLRQNGFVICAQSIVNERGKFYLIDRVEYGISRSKGMTGDKIVDARLDENIDQGIPEEIIWAYGAYTFLNHEETYIEMINTEKNKLAYARSIACCRAENSAEASKAVRLLDDRIHRLDVVLQCTPADSR